VSREVSATGRGRQSWRDTATLLWPSPQQALAVRRTPPLRSKPGATSWWVLPTAAHPRFFVPVESPGGWRVVARSGAGGLADQVQALASRLLRTGMGKVLPIDRFEVAGTGIEQHLQNVLRQPVRIGVRLGRARADRVVVLQVLAADGSRLAFAKLGTTEISDARLASEASNLSHIADLDPDRVGPSLMHGCIWADRQIVVISAVDSRPQAADEVPVAPMRRLAEAAGTVETTLGESDFLARLRAEGGPRPRSASASTPTWTSSRRASRTRYFGSVPGTGDWVPWT
jgi:hypothetical protein